MQSEPFYSEEIQFNKNETAIHESLNSETQDSNFVKEVKKAMVISPMKIKQHSIDDNKPLNFVH